MKKRLAVVFLLALAARAQPLFRQVPVSLDPGAGPYAVATGDFNGDGIPDVAYADYRSSSVKVLLGDGRGGFLEAPGSPFPAGGSETLSVIAGDFNGDGNLDLVALNNLGLVFNQGSAVVFLGDGTGRFTQVPKLAIRTPVSFTSADFNRDGKLDLAFGTNEGLLVYFGDGAGGLSSNKNVVPGGLTAIIAADFNRDGIADLAAFNVDGSTVTTLLGDGAGGFRAGKETAVPQNMTSLLSGDWNGDGVADLAVSGISSVSILLGDGRGGFIAHSVLPYPAAYRAALASADFDGDGRADLIVSTATEGIILLGDGSGNFREAQRLPGTPDYSFAMPADVNRDGKPDLVFAGGQVWLNALKAIPVSPQEVRLQASAGQMARPVRLDIGPVPGLSAASDQNWLRFDGTQIVADATSLKAGSYQAILRFSAAGYFGAAVRVNLTVVTPSGALVQTYGPVSSSGPSMLTDLNGDGKPDLIGLTLDSITVKLNDGAGKFADAPVTSPLLEGGRYGIGDFDGDGIPDVAVLGGSGVILYAGDGTGGFRTGRATNIRTDFRLASAIGVADLNGDGIPDIVGELTSQQPFFVLLGDGRGGFQSVANATPILRQTALVLNVADVNGDGFPDLIFPEIAGENLYVWVGDGRGRFAQSQKINFGPASVPGNVAVGDWNSDGKSDLAVVNHGYIYDSLVTVLLGSGNGLFTKLADYRFPSVQVSGAIVPADVDGDGTLDLLVSRADGTSSLLFGDGAGAFQESTRTRLPFVQWAADLNGDGRTDLVTSGRDGISVFLGSLAGAKLALTQEPPNPFTIGYSVAIDVAVTAAPDAFRAPDGTVALYDGPSLVGTASLVNGSARFVTKFAPGTHRFQATYNGDSRSAPASGDLTVVETGAPAQIRALGNGQPLQALVTDGNGNPVSGAGVIFMTPAFGPSGLFAGSNRWVAITDASGLATAFPLTSNGISGDYQVTATVSGYPGFSAAYQLHN